MTPGASGTSLWHDLAMEHSTACNSAPQQGHHPALPDCRTQAAAPVHRHPRRRPHPTRAQTDCTQPRLTVPQPHPAVGYSWKDCLDREPSQRPCQQQSTASGCLITKPSLQPCPITESNQWHCPAREKRLLPCQTRGNHGTQLRSHQTIEHSRQPHSTKDAPSNPSLVR